MFVAQEASDGDQDETDKSVVQSAENSGIKENRAVAAFVGFTCCIL